MKQVLTLFCCLLAIAASAQPPNISHSKPFEERDNLPTKILMCKNGNTLLFNFKQKEGVMVDVYDASHKAVAHADNNSEVLNTKNYRGSQLRGIYNIGDQVVAFLEVHKNNKLPQLFRVAFSLETGKVLSEEETAIVPEEFRSKARAAKYVDVGQHFVVRKDPTSDAYAIATHFMQNLEGAATPFVFHYNGKHEEIGRNVINGPGNRYVFSYYNDLMVRGTDEVWIATSPFNNGKGGTRASSAILVTRLRGKDTTSAIVNSRSSRKQSDVAFCYNPKEQTVQVMVTVLMSSHFAASMGPGAETIINTYASFIAALDAQSLSPKYINNINYGPATKFRNSHYGIAVPYTCVPMDILMNNDGSTTVLSQENSKLPSQDVVVVDYDG